MRTILRDKGSAREHLAVGSFWRTLAAAGSNLPALLLINTISLRGSAARWAAFHGATLFSAVSSVAGDGPRAAPHQLTLCAEEQGSHDASFAAESTAVLRQRLAWTPRACSNRPGLFLAKLACPAYHLPDMTPDYLKHGLTPTERRDARRLAKHLHKLRRIGVSRHLRAVMWFVSPASIRAKIDKQARIWDVAALYTALDKAPWKVEHVTSNSDFDQSFHQGVRFTLIDHP